MKKEILEKAKVIEAVLFDVDGVMTDGKLYFSEKEKPLKLLMLLTVSALNC